MFTISSRKRVPAFGERPCSLRYRPRFDILEDRFLLATVTTLGDGNVPGTLRGAITLTPAGGVVDFLPGLSGTITLTSILSINKSLTIQGPGAGLVTVSGAGKTRIFNVASGADVTISGLTIANGSGPAFFGDSAAITNSGNLTLADCKVDSTPGGGLANHAVLTVTNGTFTNNVGGLSNDGTATVTNSTF